MKRMLITWLAILILLLSLAACSQDDGAGETENETAAPTSTTVDEVFEDAAENDLAQEPVELHQPVVLVMTNTPPPASPTPEATTTPEPTTVPPTNTPVPVQPTSPPPPPPTAIPPTAEPPPPPPPAIGANGLVASQFVLQDRSDFVVNGKIWFEFTVANSTGNDVGYYSLGVMPKKDGADRVEWYQQSYKGQNSTIPPGGFSWEDNIKLPETGDYTLRLVMCFDSYDSCTTGSGTYQSLSGEIPITVHND